MMGKNICHYIFSSLLSKNKMSLLLKNIFFYTNHKSQNRKFLWLGKTFVPYCFALFMALNTKMWCFYALIS